MAASTFSITLSADRPARVARRLRINLAFRLREFTRTGLRTTADSVTDGILPIVLNWAEVYG